MRHRPTSATARAVLVALIVLAGVGVVGQTPASAATTITVGTTTDTNNFRFASLRRAITNANGNGQDTTIVLQAGATYDLTVCNALSENANANGDLDHTAAQALTIEGNGATIRQTCAGERVLQAVDGALTLRNLTITGGDALTDANQPDPQGGGVNAADGVTLVGSRVTANAAVGSGGGIFTGGSATLTRTEVSGNTSGFNGGGITAFNGVTLNASAVVANTGGETGGIASGFGPITVNHSTVADSVETTPGVGTADGVELDVLSGSIVLRHATIRGGDGDGPAIKGGGSTFASAIDRGAADAACSSTLSSTGDNAASDASCSLAGAGDQSSVADLGLGALADNGGPTRSIRPTTSSVLIDAVLPCGSPAGPDQRGVPRPQGVECDGGAVELRVRPDAMLRRAGQGTFVGDNKYGTNGVGQTVTLDTGGLTKVVFDLRFQNDGERRARIRLAGPGTDANFTVRYLQGTTNVTSTVVAGTFLTGQLNPGGATVLRLEVTPRAAAAVGTIRNLLVTGTVSDDPAAVDAVLARVRRT